MSEAPLLHLPDKDALPQPEQLPAPTMEDTSPLRSLGRKMLSKAVILATTAGLLASGHAKPSPVEFREDPYHAPQWEMTIPGDTPTNLRFEDLRDGGAFAAAPTEHIAPNEFLQKLGTIDEPFMSEINLSPVDIKDPKGFSDWVKTQSKREDLREHAGVVEGKETPQQLIRLAADTVTANVDYHNNPDSVDAIVDIYRKPMDENLETGRVLQCEGYSAATKAVFDELKKMYPHVLQNTELVTHSGIMEGHVWNMAVQVTSPNSADVAFIDTTAGDPTFEDLSNPNALHFIEGISKIHEEKSLIDNATFKRLMDEYDASPQATSHDRKEIEQNRDWLEMESLSN